MIGIDGLIVAVFLLANIFVGLSYGRGVTNIKEYALGDRNFSTGAIVATIVATYVSGSGFFITLSRTYTDGLSYVIAKAFMGFSLVIMAYVFIPRMKRFLGHLSVAELMGKMYGTNVRLITAISGTIGAIGAIAVQFKACSNIFTYFLGISPDIVLITAGMIVTLYSAFGGIKSVTYTDVLQFVVFGVVFPLVGLLIWSKLYQIDNFHIAEAFQIPKYNILKVINPETPGFWTMLALLAYYAIPGMSPPFIQRVMIGNNIKQVKKAFLIAALLLFVIGLAIAWIPFLIYSDNPNLDSNDLLGYILNNFTVTGLKGALIIGVTAMVMSTADSEINATSVLFAHDFCSPLKLSEQKVLIISKIAAIVFGIFGIVLALTAKDLLNIILLANSFYMPVVTVPLMASILGLQTNSKSVLTGMFAGLAIVIMWKLAQIEADCIIVAMIVNFVFLLISTYFTQNNGIVFINFAHEDNQKLHGDDKLSFFERLREQYEDFSLKKTFSRHLPKDEMSYTALGGYLFIFTLATVYSMPKIRLGIDGLTMIHLYGVMILLSIALALYPIWPANISKSKTIYFLWYVVIFAVLIVGSSFFAMVGGVNSLQFANFAVNFLITAILIGWRLSLVLTLIGFSLSLKLYELYTGKMAFELNQGSLEFMGLYALMLVGGIVLIFLKPKQEEFELTEQKADHFAGRINYQEQELKSALDYKNELIRNYAHENNAPLTGILSMSEILFESYDKLPEKMRKESVETIYKSAIRLNSYDKNLNDLSTLSNANTKLNIQEINLSKLIQMQLKNCCKVYLDEETGKKYNFIINNLEKNIIIEGDEYYLSQTIDNLIINAITYAKGGTITMNLVIKEEGVEFSITDEGIGIPKEEIYDIFGSFMVSSKTKTSAGGRGIGLALCKKVIEMHQGRIWAESSPSKTSFYFSLPYRDLKD